MRGKDVRLDKVSIRFGDATAVQPTDLSIHAGEFFSILGPSGCGKTTILRTVSGFIQPTEGRVLIGGEDMAGKGPNERPTALIFQNLALFPLMSVAENVAFGLEARGVSKKERLRRAQELLELVALDQFGDKRPADLSGGQRQRVAIARALAVEPSVLLLDEPLSALDPFLRIQVRAELKRLQNELGITFIHVTHSQEEAMALSDLAVVMNAGRIEQADDPRTVFSRPATPFVARFIGGHNVIDLPGGGGPFAVRTDRIRVARGLPGENGMEGLPARVAMVEYQGSFVQLRLAGEGAYRDTLPEMTAILSDDAFEAAPLSQGEAVTVGWSGTDAHRLRVPAHDQALPA